MRSFLVLAPVLFSSLFLGCATEVNANAGGGSPEGGAPPAETTGGGGASGVGGSTDGGSGAAEPLPNEEGEGTVPPEPGEENPGDGSSVVFAVNQLFVGDTTAEGVQSDTAWQAFGYNLDGLISQKGGGHCKLVAGASPSTLVDGIGGLDNSFGKNVIPQLVSLMGFLPGGGGGGTLSDTATDSIEAGEFTLLFDFTNLGTGADYNPLLVRGYAGATLGTSPAWDGSDAWPVVPELLTDPADVTTAKISFAESYTTGNTWVSGTTTPTLDLSLALADLKVNIRIRNAVISMDLNTDHTEVVSGTIAGVIDTEEFIDAVESTVASVDPTYCAYVGFITGDLRAASDILNDATQDPTKTCNAISIGMGFTAKRALLGSILPENTTPAPSCD